MACPFCGGPLGLLGSLGCLIHYRCRDCGMMFSKPSKSAKAVAARKWQADEREINRQRGGKP